MNRECDEQEAKNRSNREVRLIRARLMRVQFCGVRFCDTGAKTPFHFARKSGRFVFSHKKNRQGISCSWGRARFAAFAAQLKAKERGYGRALLGFLFGVSGLFGA